MRQSFQSAGLDRSQSNQQSSNGTIPAHVEPHSAFKTLALLRTHQDGINQGQSADDWLIGERRGWTAALAPAHWRLAVMFQRDVSHQYTRRNMSAERRVRSRCTRDMCKGEKEEAKFKHLQWRRMLYYCYYTAQPKRTCALLLSTHIGAFKLCQLIKDLLLNVLK